MIWHGHRIVYDHSTPLVLLDREGFYQWVRCCAGRPYEGFGPNLPVAQGYDAGPCVRQARVQAERHAARFHPLLRIASQRFAQLWQDAIP